MSLRARVTLFHIGEQSPTFAVRLYWLARRCRVGRTRFSSSPGPRYGIEASRSVLELFTGVCCGCRDRTFAIGRTTNESESFLAVEDDRPARTSSRLRGVHAHWAPHDAQPCRSEAATRSSTEHALGRRRCEYAPCAGWIKVWPRRLTPVSRPCRKRFRYARFDPPRRLEPRSFQADADWQPLCHVAHPLSPARQLALDTGRSRPERSAD